MFRHPFLLVICFFVISAPAMAQDAKPYNPDDAICGADNRGCVLRNLRGYAKKIEQDAWRDQTFRELAKSFAGDGHIDVAISIIDDIGNADTKAMTIRGIGMEMADLGFDQVRLDAEFAKLRAEAEKIDHPPSYAIALTYIAMSQAFAGDNDGAWETAADMENDALRHKAFAETAEIQAERKDFDATMKSITFIDNEAFQNKAYAITSKIFANQGMFDESYKAAMQITNAYKKSQSLQYMLNKQKAEQDDVKKEQSP